MIFQEPMTALNPCFTVGFQIGEALEVHLEPRPRGSAASARSRCCARSASPSRNRASRAFPHQLSGGMSQRVMIAMAIACNPKLLIADEPTTALDVTIQAQILDLLRDLQRERGMALVLITHDMGVVGETAERVQVKYAGQVVENQPGGVLVSTPAHPYTAALLAALPERAGDHRRLASDPRRGARAVATVPKAACSPALRLRHRLHAQASGRGSRGFADWRACAAIARSTPAGQPRRRDDRAAARSARTSAAIYEITRGLFRQRARVKAVDGVSFTLQRGEDARRGRRIRLRQIDAGAPAHHDRSAERRRCRDRRQAVEGGVAARSAACCAARCRWCSRTRMARSIRARPSAACSRSRSRSTPAPSRGRAARAGAGDDGAGRAAARPGRALSAHVLGRPAPAHRHRPRADAAPAHRRRRRAGLRARRLDPRAGAEPAARSAGGVPRRLCLHQPRSLGGAPHRRRGDGDVSRPRGGARRQGGDLRAAAPSLHARAAGGDAGAEIRRPRAVRAGARRAALPAGAAAGLPLSHALPARDRALPRGRCPSCACSTACWSPVTTRNRLD